MTSTDDKRKMCQNISNGFFEISGRAYQWWGEMELYSGFPGLELNPTPEFLGAIYRKYAEKYEKLANKFKKLSKSKMAIYLIKEETLREELGRIRRIDRSRNSAM